MVENPINPQESGRPDFLKQAYTLKTLDDAMRFYNQWAGDYDKQMEDGLGYVSPGIIASKLAAALNNRNSRVLDVGCGTGLTSLHLHELGIAGPLDGIDINATMLEQAAKRGLFTTLLEADITRPLDIADCTYEAVICSGTFTLAHVGAEALDELIRVLKPGGLLACTVHKEVFDSQGFRTAFDQLERDRALERVERSEGPFFRDQANDGLYCVYRKA